MKTENTIQYVTHNIVDMILSPNNELSLSEENGYSVLESCIVVIKSFILNLYYFN